MFEGRVRKPTYDELEEELLNPKLVVLNRPIKIPRFNLIQNVDAVDFNEFDLNNHNLKIMIDKETQKDYELQNHDAFPDMYDEIDATGESCGNNSQLCYYRSTGSDMGNDEKRTQTKRYIPKDFDIYSSAQSSSDKPSSPPSPHHISRPTSSESSEKKEPRKKGFGFFSSKEYEMYKRLRSNTNDHRRQSSSSSSSLPLPSSSSSSVLQQLTQQQMARSRSRDSSRGSDERHTSSSGSSYKKSK